MRKLRKKVHCPEKERLVFVKTCKKDCDYFHKESIGVTRQTRGEEIIECEFWKT